MAQQGKKSSKGEKNDDRRCRKAWKKNKGVSPKAHNGKSVGGYTINPTTDETKARRAKNAAAKAARIAKRTKIAAKADTAA